MFGLPEQSLGAIAAASIAGLLAFLSLLVTKEQKTSEFRQAWIDALRNDLAEVLSRAHVIADAFTAGVTAEGKESWTAIREDFIAANNALIRIKLRLNPKEPGSQKLLALVTKLDEEHLIDGTANYALINSVQQELVAEAHVFLKREWKRVKRGEPVFAMVKYGSGLALLGLAAFLGYRFFFGS